MQKIFALLLCAIMTLSLFGCASGGSETTAPETTAPAEPSLSVGFGRVDITPKEAVPLGGWPNSNTRISESVSEPLYATCVAMTDGEGKTVLVFHLDLINSGGTDLVFTRAAVSKATGVPADHVILAATHTHSGPAITLTNMPSIQNYLASLKVLLPEAAKQAMEDRKPAKMYIAAAQTEKLNFIRYYLFSNGQVGSGAGDETKGLKRLSHHGEPDRSLQLVKFVREGGKDVIMVNWQGHPSLDGGKDLTNISADLVGVMRTYVERELDCNFAYFTGASGNVNNESFVEPYNNCIDQGNALGAYAVKAAANFKELPIGNISLVKRDVACSSKENEAITTTVQITAFAVGDVGFAVAPYEMFDSSGQAIKGGSPYEMTMVLSCANGSFGYIPSEFAFTCFASYEAGIAKFAPKTAEQLEGEFVSMLQEMHK